MDIKTARKYLASGKLPGEEHPERIWHTRPDPFERVWKEIQEQIDVQSGLEAKTIFEALQRKYPGEFADGQLRTLQRHLKRWRATEGPGREVFFAQQHVPGRLGQSDFTHMNELAVTIGGQSFPHLLFHFVLTYSNWEDATLCYSESFKSLSEGMQNALMGVRRRAAEPPHRPALDRREQHVERAGVHQPLRSAAAALPDGRGEDPSRQSE